VDTTLYMRVWVAVVRRKETREISAMLCDRVHCIMLEGIWIPEGKSWLHGRRSVISQQTCSVYADNLLDENEMECLEVGISCAHTDCITSKTNDFDWSCEIAHSYSL
jgi:hypothetical protein